MNILATKILGIKKDLSDKERWDKYHDHSDCSYNLMNEIAALWCCASGDEKRYYPPAYKCIARAALDYCEKEIKAHKLYVKGHMSNHDLDDPYPANVEDIRIVWAFEKICTHEQLMEVLDRAMRYANLSVFS